MSANILKIIAMVAMTIDHMGFLLFPEKGWMRIVGRIAFPIFSYFIAEGCRYTKNRRKYLAQIGLLGIGMQVVLFLVDGSLYQSVFISFTLSILLIYAIDKAKKEKQWKNWFFVIVCFLSILFLCLGLPKILVQTDYDIDYNIVGILLPVACYFTKEKKKRILVFALGLIALSAFYGGIQWFCLLAVPLLGMYNGQRGKIALKRFFYLYYPAHMCVIYLIDILLSR